MSAATAGFRSGATLCGALLLAAVAPIAAAETPERLPDGVALTLGDASAGGPGLP